MDDREFCELSFPTDPMAKYDDCFPTRNLNIGSRGADYCYYKYFNPFSTTYASDLESCLAIENIPKNSNICKAQFKID